MGCLFHRKAFKIRKLANLNNRHQTDGMCVVKHGVNFGHEEARGETGGVFASFIGSRTLAGYNMHKNNSCYMAGGTLVAAFNRLSSFVIEQGADISGLGRWSWILVGSGSHCTRIVSAYQPQKSSNRGLLIPSDGKMIQGGTVAACRRALDAVKGTN